MMPVRRTTRALAGALLLASVTFSLSTCGIGGSQYSGGGTGGTGISTGSISGFGSVVMNGVHYNTNAKTKKISNGKDNSAMMDQELFRIGMVVTVRYSPSNYDAQEIEYRNNLLGPISEISFGADNIIKILGHSVVVDNVEIFKQGDIVEVSGFVDNAGRIRSAYIISVSPPMPPPFQEFDVKGFISESSSTGFRIGPLPDGSGITVAVSYDAAAIAGFSGRLDNGIFVQVTTADTAPVAGSITATRIERLISRTDFPENVAVDFEGIVTKPWTGSGNDLSFEVEGKRVMWTADTVFTGGTQIDTQESNRKLQIQGMETGGVLSAVSIIFR